MLCYPHKAICSGLLGRWCSRCKQTAPGLEGNQAETTSTRLGCFVPDQGAIVVFAQVPTHRAGGLTHPCFGKTSPINPGGKSPLKQKEGQLERATKGR